MKRIAAWSALIAIVLGSSSFVCFAHAEDAAQIASRLFLRLAGVPISASDSRFAEMQAFIEKGEFQKAAQIATQDSRFYSVTVRDWIAPMSNRDASTRVPLNDFIATVLGATRDGRDARTLLTGNYVYEGAKSLNLAPRDRSNNNHYVQLESKPNYVASLTAVEPQYRDIKDMAGLLTTRAWAEAHYDAGTNRRAVAMSLDDFLCSPLISLKDTTLPDDRVRRDIDRAPAGVPSNFQNDCRGCHGGMDGLGGAFAKFDFVNGSIVYYGNQVAPKYNQNRTVFADGYITYDDSWINYWAERDNAQIEWRGPRSGYGVKSLGEALANTRAFSTCMTKKIFSKLCRRTPSADDAKAISALATAFEKDGYKLRSLFEQIAVTPGCIF